MANGLPPTGFEMTEDEFNTFSATLIAKTKEDGGNPTDNADINNTLKRWWKLLIDLPAAQRVHEADQLDRLKIERDGQDDGRQALDDEITRLEGRRRP
jgi:hypothetical protein